MASLILRLIKGSPLTNAEVDGNFTALNDELATKITASSVDTLTNKNLDDISNEIGANHLHFKVKATENLVAGDVVKMTGYNAGEDAYEVAKITAATDVAIGVIDGTIALGDFGAMVNTGLLEGFDTSAFSVGTILYPNTSGGFTATQPSSGTYQALAYVLRSHAVNGAALIEASDPAPVRKSTNTANTVVLRDGSGNFSAGTITAALSGNASTATSAGKWTNARTLSFTGDVTGTGSVDGSVNVATAMTLANSGVTAGSYGSGSAIPTITVDAKGRVTGVTTNSLVIPTYGTATSTATGMVKLASDTDQAVAFNAVTATAGRTYGVQLNASDQMVVNVPWTDTNTTYSKATTTNLGLVKLEDDTVQTVAANAVTATASRTYGVQLNSSDQMVVNVPWTDNNTTYTGSKGITLSGTDFRITGNEIPGSVDLNTYRTTGFYTQNANADAASGSNYPTANAGILQVINDDYGNGLHTTQLYSQYASTNYYVRTYYNGTWQAWRNLAQDTNTTYSQATSSTLGLIKLEDDTVQTVAANTVTATSGRTYGVQVNSSGQAVVNVPWVDTNTDTNNYVSGVSFSTSTGVLTLNRSGLTDLTVDLDGKYAEASSLGNYVLKSGDTMTGELIIQSADSTNLVIRNSTNAGWAGIEFSDLTSTYAQKGYFQFNHSDSVSPGSAYGATFKFSTTETALAVVNTGEYFAASTQRVFHDGYHPNADKWTTARTLSLTGDVTGSVSWDGSANASMTTTVADNSHDHTSLANVSQFRFQTNGATLTAGGNYIYVGQTNSASTYGGFRFYDITNAIRGYVYHGTADFGLLDSDGQWAVRTQTGTNPLTLYCDNNPEFYVYTTYTHSPGSSRAPIFYDSDDTTYYINPASTTTAGNFAGTVQAATFNATSTTNGGFQGIDADSATTPSFTWTGDLNTGIWRPALDTVGITTNGVSRFSVSTVAVSSTLTIDAPTFNATSTTSGGFQGIDADTVTSPSFTWTADLNTGMYRYSTDVIGFAAGGNDEFRVYTSYTFSPGSSRAPLFYDSNNTAYYANPASTSVFNALDVTTINGTAASSYAIAQAGGVIYENNQTITASYTMTTNKNGMSAGPITINSGVTVTIPSGSVWTVV